MTKLIAQKNSTRKKIIVFEIVNFQLPARDETAKSLMVSHVQSSPDSAQQKKKPFLERWVQKLVKHLRWSILQK